MYIFICISMYSCKPIKRVGTMWHQFLQKNKSSCARTITPCGIYCPFFHPLVVKCDVPVGRYNIYVYTYMYIQELLPLMLMVNDNNFPVCCWGATATHAAV